MMPFLLALVMPWNNLILNALLAFLFVLFALTDFFDGYFARKYHLETQLGALLDPMADKFLLCGVLIGLVYTQKIFFLWALIFLLRELHIMGLRSIAAERSITIPVSIAGKMKTTAQYAYLATAIANVRAGAFYPLAHLDMIENVFLGAALALTVLSAYWYTKKFLDSTRGIR
jgi:CDP-diacylglycerol--glycerol-3-phosphate 3-phosphatidyltransferase